MSIRNPPLGVKVNAVLRGIAGHSLGYAASQYVAYGKSLCEDYGPPRLRLLDGFGDFTATKQQIEQVDMLLKRDMSFAAIADTLGMREVDVVIVGLHLYTDKRTGEVRW